MQSIEINSHSQFSINHQGQYKFVRGYVSIFESITCMYKIMLNYVVLWVFITKILFHKNPFWFIFQFYCVSLSFSSEHTAVICHIVDIPSTLVSPPYFSYIPIKTFYLFLTFIDFASRGPWVKFLDRNELFGIEIKLTILSVVFDKYTKRARINESNYALWTRHSPLLLCVA